MIASTEHKLYKNLAKKGKDSILKTIRTNKGGGKGLIVGAIILLIFTLPISVLLMLDKVIGTAILLPAPGLLLLILGIYFHHKRAADWISYYREQTGYSEGEIQQINHELASPDVTIVTCRAPNAAVESFIAGFFTEHYLVMDGVDPYVRRLEDIIAVAFSDSTDTWCMVSLAIQDQGAMAVPLFTDTQRKKTLYGELSQELYRRNPKILCGQEIVCDGSHYILERDSEKILRLYKEGRPLELAR